MNMINVTQGHEDSIGLEVFFKSFLLLDSDSQSKFNLFVHTNTLQKNLDLLLLDYKVSDKHLTIGNSRLKLTILESEPQLSESFHSLIEAEREIKHGDILLTLPTTKDSLLGDGIQYTGHTDYFRKKYQENVPVMLFNSKDCNMALLTEHISLGKVEDNIQRNLVKEKITALIKNPYFEFKRFLFSGINPHCGENGLIGKADSFLLESIELLRKEYLNIEFNNPISGDILFLTKTNENSCYICAHHDQGLAPFKATSGLQATNITIGLPFLRLSPDHGTGFELYGKDKANYIGALYTMRVALKCLGIK